MISPFATIFSKTVFAILQVFTENVESNSIKLKFPEIWQLKKQILKKSLLTLMHGLRIWRNSYLHVQENWNFHESLKWFPGTKVR